MYELAIPGLVVHHPASVLATYGVFNLIDNCRIYYEKYHGTYVPVVESELNKEEFVNLLTTRSTWDKLRPESFDKTQMPLPEFINLLEVDVNLALGLATDHIIEEKEVDTGDKEGKKKKKKIMDCVGKSPFYMLARNSIYELEVCKMVNEVCESPKNTEKNLFELPPWFYQMEAGNNLGLFPEDVAKGVFKNSEKETPQNVPIICLMAVLSWNLFPVYLSFNGDITAPGWKYPCFYYPVFTVKHDRRSFMELVLHPGLTKFSMDREVWRSRGVDLVYKVKRVSPHNKGDYCFENPEALIYA